MAEKKYTLSPAAKANQVAYIGRYNKEHYKIYTYKLRHDIDAKLIDAIAKSGKSVCQLTREALEAYFGIQR